MPWVRTLSFGNALGNGVGTNAKTSQFEPNDQLYQLRLTTTLQ